MVTHPRYSAKAAVELSRGHQKPSLVYRRVWTRLASSLRRFGNAWSAPFFPLASRIYLTEKPQQYRRLR